MKKLLCAHVSVARLNFAVDKDFSYQLPAALKDVASVGARVIVPFGRDNKKREGIITEFAECDGNIPLKPIYETVDNDSFLSADDIFLARYISRKYYSTMYDAAMLLMPPGSNVRFTEYAALVSDDLSDVENISDLKKFIVDYLREKSSPVPITEILEKTNNKGARKAVWELKKYGKVDIFEEAKSTHNSKTIKIAELSLAEFQARDYMEQFLKKARAQRRLLEILIENGKTPVPDLIAFSGAGHQSIKSLSEKGVISITEEDAAVDLFKNDKQNEHDTPKPFLNEEQQTVVDAVKAEFGKFSEFLIKGVTGSGKTEVYLELCEYIIEQNRNAVILVPEIALTSQIRQRFYNRFGDKIAVLHSALSISERKSQWNKIKNGIVSIVVGARSAVFAPLPNLGMIIIDEEHETTYKSENSPRYNAKDIARYKMEKNNGLLILASATPSVENYYRAVNGEVKLLTLEKRYNNVELPEVTVVDMRDEIKGGNISVLSEELKKRLFYVRDNGQKAIILLNRRGYSTFVSCRDCGYVVKCKKCDVALTYHSIEANLKCHYCGYTEKTSHICPECKSASVRYFGSGTQKLEEELYKIFDSTQIIRMDNDTTTTKMSHERLLNRFAKTDSAILLGTQMIAKGLDFKDVSLAGVISADTTLFLGGYNGSEKTFALITQVCGRAGRGATRGNAVVQTYNPEHYAITAGREQDYNKFYNNEIVFRKNVKYPPFCEIINLLFTGAHADKILETAEGIKKILTEKVDLYDERKNYIAMYGPTPCAIPKIRDKYRFHILVKCISADLIRQSFSDAVKTLMLNNTADITIAVDVNPVNFI